MVTLEKIKKMKNESILSFYYQLRELMASGKQIDQDLAKVAFESYMVLKKTEPIWSKDKSISALVSLCQRQERDLDFPDATVKLYSQIFNKILDSTRQLYMCYDCGTTARAMFIKLVKTHRASGLTPLEQITIRRQYFQSSQSEKRLGELNKYLSDPHLKPGVVMCSIGLNELGHVFIIEILGPKKLRLYQSAHRAFTVIDSLAFDGLLKNPKLHLNWPQLNKDLSHLFTTKPWTPSHTTLFNKWFHFVDHEITPTKIRFGYTSVSY